MNTYKVTMKNGLSLFIVRNNVLEVVQEYIDYPQYGLMENIVSIIKQ